MNIKMYSYAYKNVYREIRLSLILTESHLDLICYSNMFKPSGFLKVENCSLHASQILS